ncbi:DUF402 domain-containing protein [Microbacterium sp. GXF6406]
MRSPIGTRDVSASGGTMELIGRRGDGWARISSESVSVDEAIALLEQNAGEEGRPISGSRDVVPSGAPFAPRFTPGETILWQYSRHVEAVRVVRDDERGLVIWIPAGSERLESAPADGRRTRDVPVHERFSIPWVMRETTWRGQGVLRVAPTGKPWSIWFFRAPDGTPAGVYVNLELPHRRIGGTSPSIYSRDLVLDLWIEAEHPGSEDVWLKDADELAAAVDQGRFTSAQAEAVRTLADHATREVIASGAWPLDEGWDTWNPDAVTDAPVRLPANAIVDAARARSGRTSLEG